MASTALADLSLDRPSSAGSSTPSSLSDADAMGPDAVLEEAQSRLRRGHYRESLRAVRRARSAHGKLQTTSGLLAVELQCLEGLNKGEEALELVERVSKERELLGASAALVRVAARWALARRRVELAQRVLEGWYDCVGVEGATGWHRKDLEELMELYICKVLGSRGSLEARTAVLLLEQDTVLGEDAKGRLREKVEKKGGRNGVRMNRPLGKVKEQMKADKLKPQDESDKENDPAEENVSKQQDASKKDDVAQKDELPKKEDVSTKTDLPEKEDAAKEENNPQQDTPKEADEPKKEEEPTKEPMNAENGAEALDGAPEADGAAEPNKPASLENHGCSSATEKEPSPDPGSPEKQDPSSAPRSSPALPPPAAKDSSKLEAVWSLVQRTTLTYTKIRPPLPTPAAALTKVSRVLPPGACHRLQAAWKLALSTGLPAYLHRAMVALATLSMLSGFLGFHPRSRVLRVLLRTLRIALGLQLGRWLA